MTALAYFYDNFLSAHHLLVVHLKLSLNYMKEIGLYIYTFFFVLHSTGILQFIFLFNE